MTDPATPVTAGEIADLLAWARRLSAQGRHINAAERAAYQAAKTKLLARIAATPDPHMAGGGL